MDAIGAIPLKLVLLGLTLIVALVTIVYILIAESARSSALERASAAGDANMLAEGLLQRDRRSFWVRLSEWLTARQNGQAMSADKPIAERLVQAGFDSPAAPPLFSSARVACGLVMPLLGWVLAPSSGGGLAALVVLMSVMIGGVAPTAVLDRLVERRRERIRRAVPDALDLLVVCMEAGVSLDGSMLRVSRDMATIHPELAFELGQIVRKVGAGIPRDRALQQLPQRTGVEELRTLVASMIQSERLGTSIARVLRINAESLRLRRKQAIEKRAAEASLKMLMPLALFMLPALMIVIIGPAIIELMTQFGR